MPVPAIVLLAAAAFIGVGSPCARCSEPPSDETIARETDAVVRKALETPGAAGVQVCIALRGGVVLDRGYGAADAASGRAVTPETAFHACSVSKQFVAAAVMRLVEEGKLGLDDPIRKHIPELPESLAGVTLHHLLTHTSGLKGYTEVAAFLENESREMSHAEVLAYFKDVPLRFRPGERWEYCNSGSYLLGMAVERASGKDYGTFLREEFFAPLKLAHTGYEPHPDAGGLALGHVPGAHGAERAPEIAWANAFAGGGIVSTARELVLWKEALAAGRALSPESYRRMTTEQKLADGAPTGYGYCWYVREHHGHRVVFHTGHGPGYSAWLARYPDDGLTLAVLSNSSAVSAPRLGHAIAMGALGVDAVPKDLAVPAACLRCCPGTYREDSLEEQATFRVFEREGRLFGAAEGRPTSRLVYQGEGVFIVEAAPHISIAFPVDGGGADGGPAATCTTDDQVRARRAARVK